MARIRTIKPEFWSSEQVMECSRGARLLFIGMWNFCDDAGRCKRSAKTLRAQVFPGDDDVSVADVEAWISELSTHCLITEYTVNGHGALIQVDGWHHQRINRPQPSKLPEPTEKTDTNKSLSEHSVSTHEEFTERSLQDLPCREGKGSTPHGAPQARVREADPDLPEPAEAHRRMVELTAGIGTVPREPDLPPVARELRTAFSDRYLAATAVPWAHAQYRRQLVEVGGYLEQLDDPRAAIRAMVETFFADDFAAKNRFPFSLLAKDPSRWAAKAPRRPGEIDLVAEAKRDNEAALRASGGQQ